MPPIRFRFAAGMVTLILEACAGSPPSPAATPAPPPTPSPPAPVATVPANHNWVQNLTFSGDLSGTLSTIVPDQPNRTSECTGPSSRAGGTWASSLFGPLGADVYGLTIVASPYRGPGIYRDAQASIQVHSADNARVWQSVAADPVTFTVAADEQSGTIEASLDNLTTGKTSLKVAGSWSCRG